MADIFGCSLVLKDDDLKVTIVRSSMVKPAAAQSQRRFMHLSVIDAALRAIDVKTIHFFSKRDGFPPELVAETLEGALGELLVPYDFVAGRLCWLHPEDERPVIDCNSAGVCFRSATSELTLSEIGDLEYPRDAFQALVPKVPEFAAGEDKPLCLVQVTTFKCGCFAMGLSLNHVLFDGIAFKAFLQNLASFSAGKGLYVTPYIDGRSMLKGRSPPQISFDHPELVKLDVSVVDQTSRPEFLERENPKGNQKELKIRLFRLSSDDITKLKEKAEQTTPADSLASVTTFNVVAAHAWRCKVLTASYLAGDDRGGSANIYNHWKLLYTINIRSRLQPPLPAEYSGNAVLEAYAMATTEELEGRPFGHSVRKVWEGMHRMTNDYARSVIDFREVCKGIPRGHMVVTTWCQLGWDDVEYPWGKQKCCCPLMDPCINVTLLTPAMEKGEEIRRCVDDHQMNGGRSDAGSSEGGRSAGTYNKKKGVNCYQFLCEKEYKTFKELFEKI